MDKIKWGIIGCGGIADRRTIPGLLLSDNSECVAVMDKNAEVAIKVGEKYGVSRVYTDVNELLEQSDIDAVYIATPVFCHKEQAFMAADAGKHILLEKPMGLTTAEGKEIMDYCNKKGVKLGIAFMMRFHDAHERIKEKIENGEIGEIVSAYAKFNCLSPVSEVKWRQTKAFSGGGTMMDMGIHCIDLLQYMTGMKSKEVVGMSGNQIFKYPDTEDAATAIMRMENGALFCVESNFNIPEEVGCRFEIYGTEGCITAEGTIGQTETGKVKISKPDKEPYELQYISGNMYTKEISKFADAVISGGPIPVTAEEGIFNQKIVEAVYESQECGKRIIL